MSTTTSSTKNTSDNPDATGGKTLSRTLLYAPLAAYSGADDSQDDHKNVETYLASRNTLPKNLQEKAMMEFCHKVGVDFHRYLATTKDSKNNGSRPSSLSETEDRMRQRALTLVGGGINKPTASTISSRNTRPQRRKRKQFAVHNNFPLDDSDAGTVGEFVQELNTLWNEYVIELLQLQQQSISADIIMSSPAFVSRVSATLSNPTIQLVGAQVCIKSCAQQRNRVGDKGYLVGTTVNTWRVIMLASPKTMASAAKRRKKRAHLGKKQEEEPKSASSPESKAEKAINVQSSKNDPSQNAASVRSEKEATRSWEVSVIPKRGTTLSFLIPLDRGDEAKDDGKSVGKDANSSSDAEAGTWSMLVVDLQNG